MEWKWDEENKILLINGKATQDFWTGISLELASSAKRIIQVHHEKDGRVIFKHYTDIDKNFITGEFIPTVEERNYIFEMLIGI